MLSSRKWQPFANPSRKLIVLPNYSKKKKSILISLFFKYCIHITCNCFLLPRPFLCPLALLVQSVPADPIAFMLGRDWASISISFFVPQVSQHKTKETFGQALIPLKKDEYRWFSHFIRCRRKLPCGDSETFFANSNGGPFTKLLESFQASWKRFGLPGTPTFTLVRSSISTCVRPVFIQSVWVRTATL